MSVVSARRSSAWLPGAWSDSPWYPRLSIALDAVTSAGAALVQLRGGRVHSQEVGSQLKTSADLAAEGWVLGLLEGSFPQDRFLAEERFAREGSWRASDTPFWTIDALDGTRSFVEGYPGFCVQVAFVEGGRPVFGVVAEPVAQKAFVALERHGGYELSLAGPTLRRLEPRRCATWPEHPRFVDSTRPGGAVGELFAEKHGEFVECGSVGLKACRVAADRADVYAKAFTFRLWDVAPIEVLLRETGCGLRLWSGHAIDYSGGVIEFSNLVAAPDGLLDALVASLSRS